MLVLPTDRVVLIDLENVVGFRPRPRTLRIRVTALLEAARPRHHVVAAYAGAEGDDDPTASTLASLGVAPLRVAPGPDAAETALLAHARRMQAEGCALFTVCSSDHAFAALASADLGRVEVLIWADQPISAKLEQAVHQVHRLPRPPAAAKPTAEHPPLTANRVDPSTDHAKEVTPSGSAKPKPMLMSLATAVVTGIGLAFGHRIADALLPRREGSVAAGSARSGRGSGR